VKKLGPRIADDISVGKLIVTDWATGVCLPGERNVSLHGPINILV
jgi:hypothetical protein